MEKHLIIAAATAGLFQAAPAAELVHQWTFDDGETPGFSYGSVIADGLVSGAPTFPAGVTPGTRSLTVAESSEDRIDIPSDLLWESLGEAGRDFSLTFWMRRLNEDGDADGVFDADSTLAGTLGPGFQFLINATDHPDAPDAFIFAASDGTTREVDTTSFAIAADDDAWHHFALLVSRDDGTGALSVEIFLDGASVDTLNYPGVTGSIRPDQDLQLGVLTNSASFGLEGSLDDFRIYDGLVESATITRLATAPPPVRFTGFEVGDDQIDFTWESAEGRVYWIEDNPDLAADWLTAADETDGTGAELSASISRSAPAFFYRLRIR